MVGGSTQQQQKPLQLQLPSSSATATTSPEEEFLKRNTDCVYFLASPLTCKKGSECEYRHSDIVRVNPRDCWFWLNGNCLNPKCAFRHPPLDGMLGGEVPTPVRPSVPQLQTPATTAPFTCGKQGVPCIFFQKGFCLKGDRCPFLHAPSSANNKVAQSQAATLVVEPPTLKKSIQEQKIPQINVTKSAEMPPRGKAPVRVEAPARNGVVIEKNVPPPLRLGGDELLARYRPSSVPPVTNEISTSRSNRVYQAHVSDNDSILNGKEADEFSREPSPGFDVLVDDELRDSDYYHNEEQFGRSRGQDGMPLNPMNDYDLVHGYNSMTDVDQDIYRDPRDYDSYEQGLQGQYAWEEHSRASSERMLGGSSHPERRRYPRDESPDQINESDLRHRILKQRRGGNGLRSVINREHARESHAEEWNRRPPRRDNHLMAPQEGSLSSRLRGRIKIPGKSTSPVNENGFRAEREVDMGRHRARFSPGRPHISSNQGRLGDRIKGTVNEDFKTNEGTEFRGLRIRRDIITGNDTEFTRPKRLAELKMGRSTESYEQQTNDQQSLRKRKNPKMESHQEFEGNLSFEGPKSLSEILKRKRGPPKSGITSGNKEGDIQEEIKESLLRSTMNTNKEEEFNSFSGDFGGAEKQTALIDTEKVKSTDEHSHQDASELENEEGLIDDDDAMDNLETEAYDNLEGDYDYEQVDGEEYNLDEEENGDPEEEYLDEDEGDDFAKKMGVMIS